MSHSFSRRNSLYSSLHILICLLLIVLCTPARAFAGALPTAFRHGRRTHSCHVITVLGTDTELCRKRHRHAC